MKRNTIQCTLLESLSSIQNKVTNPDSGKKKTVQWVSSAFDSGSGQCGTQNISETKTFKRNLNCAFGNKSKSTPSRNRNCKGSGISPEENALENLWVDKHFPSSVDELAVHKRKVQELETWLKNNLTCQKPAPVILLTGPSGVGKTTTLKVLANKYKCDVEEWTNPLTSTFETFSNTWNTADYSSMEGSNYESQINLFKDFLLRASKYKRLDLLGCEQFQRKIILVEDYPNIFFQDPASFHSIIQKYMSTGLNPLVFVISDSSSGSHNERLLFPSDFQHNIGMSHISFNPVALTILTKVLTKIALKESSKSSSKVKMPSKTILESIALSSNGDIRGAVNTLQFSCLKDTSDLVGTFSQKRKHKSKSTSHLKQKATTSTDSSSGEGQSMPCIGGKDGSLFLFRALGKILYCKRETDPSQNQSRLPAHLVHHERLPLIEVPEEVVDKSHLSAELFSTFLQQNYINFFHNIEDIERASEYLSDADIFTIDWSSRNILQDYAVSISTRGLMHSNAFDKDSDTRMVFRPLHKPEMYSVRRKLRDRSQTSKDIFSFPIRGVSNEVLLTEIIPYLKLTNIVMHSPRQISFVNDICTFPKLQSRLSHLERLEESEVSCIKSLLNSSDSKESSLSNSQLSITPDNVVTSDTEEIVIEEFDD